MCENEKYGIGVTEEFVVAIYNTKNENALNIISEHSASERVQHFSSRMFTKSMRFGRNVPGNHWRKACVFVPSRI